VTASQLGDRDIRRYARHIVLPELGGEGQLRLRNASVLVVGAGGLGSPLALYLAAAGVGRIGLVDDDRVAEDNLHRQVLFAERDVGRRKVEAGAEHLKARDSATETVIFAERLTRGNARTILGPFDIVADGSDNFETRLLVQETCLELGRTLVSAAVQGMDGQLTTFKAHLGPPHPCLACLFPERPEPRALPSCAQGGVLGPVAGVLGTLQAVEVIKEIVGGFPSLSGTLLVYDARSSEFTRLAFARRPDCALCGGERGCAGATISV